MSVYNDKITKKSSYYKAFQKDSLKSDVETAKNMLYNISFEHCL